MFQPTGNPSAEPIPDWFVKWTQESHKVAFSYDPQQILASSWKLPSTCLLCKTTFENTNMPKNLAHFGTAQVIYLAIHRRGDSRMSR